MLQLNELSKRFGSLIAVDGLSLHVRKGEVFGLLGPNGAGKSTTIAMALGLIAPDSGTIEIEGHGPPTNPRARRAIGLAPQALALYEELTAEENLRFLGQVYGLSGGSLNTAIDRVLELVSLTPRRKDRAKTFSGGMKRRLNLAAALIHDPELILLDEPTAGVDPQSRNNILDTVRTLAGLGRTIVYTTHYMEEAEKVCDRVGIIDKGRLLDVGTVGELISRHAGKSVVTVENRDGSTQRLDTDDPLKTLAGVIQSNDQARALHVERPHLESVFLTLTGRSLRD